VTSSTARERSPSFSLADSLAPGAEVTIEADPGTFGPDELREWRRLGVTRVSLGVQALDPVVLAAAGRTHTAHDAELALAAVKVATAADANASSAVAADGAPALASWSLDLIAGLPLLTAERWEACLDRVVTDLRPPHVSVYDLTLEPGTPFGDTYLGPDNGGQPRPSSLSPLPPPPLPSHDASAAQLRRAATVLEAAGYERYEVSSFALPGHRSRHNQVYWSGGSYAALGNGASSLQDGRRTARPRRVADWERWVVALERRGDGCAAAVDVDADDAAGAPPPPPDPPGEVLLDATMLRLRTSDGLRLDEVEARWGASAADALRSALEPHAIAQPPRTAFLEGGARARLTDPDGFLVCNGILADCFAALQRAGVAEGAADGDSL